MKIGTKSILFGVHQFIWHPITVGLAWLSLYKRWPCWWEWVAIFCHDLGYLGCPDMDGEVGRKHPIKGAQYAEAVTRWIAATYVVCRHPVRMMVDLNFQMQAMMAIADTAEASRHLALGHSRYYAAEAGIEVSELFRADKLCIRFDPEWFYIFRATLTEEIFEYMQHAPEHIWESQGAEGAKRWWSAWYRKMVEERFG